MWYTINTVYNIYTSKYTVNMFTYLRKYVVFTNYYLLLLYYTSMDLKGNI